MPMNLILIASGSGTGANAIMEAWRRKQIPEIDNIVLMSTRPGAGCLEKARDLGVNNFVIEPPSSPLTSQERVVYQQRLEAMASFQFAELVFLVGCVVVLPPISTLPMYNIHPADPEFHGGQGMYGLQVHEHVLAEAVDLVRRGKKDLGRGRFFTHPTVHEATAKPDDGPPLLRGTVEIPNPLILQVLAEQITLVEAAKELQKVVLPYEWLMLPTAVRMAAARILGASN